MSEKRLPMSLLTVATSLCAALYAIGCYTTAYIPSPWGFGQFRPAVIIPAFFATIFGPMPAGIGAAVGTLIADSVKHGCLYPGSLIAAVPGNLVGFYLFGYIVKKKFTWERFILAANLTLTVANLIVAFLYVFCYKFLYASALEFHPADLTLLSIGLTIFWFVTMLPFVLVVTPPLIRAAAAAIPSVVPEQVRTHSLKQELPKTTFSLAMLTPGLIMLLIGLATSYTYLGEYTFATFGETTHTLVQLMFYGSGVVLSILGIAFYAGKRSIWGFSGLTFHDATCDKKMKKFEAVAVGGTFDEFHKGHRALLLRAFEVGNRVLIGLSSDDFARELRKPHEVATYDERSRDLKNFLKRQGVLDRVEIIPLHDPYGVTLSRGCIDGIVVSRETEPRAYEINEKRKARGLPPLGIVVIEMIPAEDRVPISTRRIRRREIDHEGCLLKS